MADDARNPKVSDQELRDWIVSTVDVCLDEAIARFDGARYNQRLTPAHMRVLIATSSLPQYMQTMMAARYSEKYEKEEDDGPRHTG